MQEYFEKLVVAANTALQQQPEVVHTYQVAGQTITMRFASQEFANLVHPPLAHLEIFNLLKSDLTVLLFESESTGIVKPEVPENFKQHEIWRFHDGDLTGYGYLMANREGMMWLNREQKLAIYWVPSRESITVEDRARPLLWLWAWWFSVYGTQVLHGACIAGESSSVLLVGVSGSGKSTTAQLALNSKLSYIADDYTLVNTQTSDAYNLFNACRLVLEDCSNYPWLEASFAAKDDEKAIYFLYPKLKEKLSSQKKLKAILVPKITGQLETKITPINSLHVLRALAPSTLMQLPMGVNAQSDLKAMANLVRNLPSYSLELGTDRFQTVELLIKFLKDD